VKAPAKTHEKLVEPPPLAAKQHILKAQAKNHEKAAEHHTLAAKHHLEAGKYCESGDHKTAAHHAHIAGSHADRAMEHGDESKKLYAAWKKESETTCIQSPPPKPFEEQSTC
jgi:hypothetical protein